MALRREPGASLARRAIRRSGAIALSCPPRPAGNISPCPALRGAGSLTPALLLRSLLGGEQVLLRTQALAELSGLPLPLVAAFILEAAKEGFARRARPPGWPEGPASRARLFAPRSQSKRRSARRAMRSNCRSCRRSSTPASSATIRRLPRFGRCSWRFAAPGGENGSIDFAREASAPAPAGPLPLALGCRHLSTTIPIRAPRLIAGSASPPTGVGRSGSRRPRQMSREDRAPPIELPPELVARLNDAA